VADWAQIDEIYTKYMQMMILGRIGVKEGLDLAAKEMDKILLEEEGRS
jgi:multiple sugar transport system substrate-binding protein